MHKSHLFIKQRTPVHTNALANLLQSFSKSNGGQILRTLETFINILTDAVVIVDEHRYVAVVNPATERIFGYTEAELCGKNIDFLIAEPGKYHRRIQNPQSSVITEEIKGLHKSGSMIHLDLLACEMSIDGRRLSINVLRDITGRKTMEDDLRKLTCAVEKSPSSVMITDVRGVIEYVNPCFVKTMGYSHEELIGKTPRIIKSDAHPPELYARLWETILAGNEWHGEFCNKAKDGRLLWELQSITPFRDSAGKITHFVSVKIDDTERKRAEKRLRFYAHELARSNNALKDFAATASHDLQEPLRKISTFGMLLRKCSPSLDDRGKDYVERMQRAARRMQVFIDDLLKYSKVSMKPREFEATDLGKVVSDAIVDLEYSIMRTKARFTIGSLPVVDGNGSLLCQLFQNLIGNALKFRKENEPPEVSLTSRCTNEFWEIIVEDKGIGFDMKYQKRIFSPFERLNGRSKYEGSGMGLAICKKIVDIHNGKILVESEPRKGARFIIALPLNKD